MRGVAFFVVLGLTFLLFRACGERIVRVGEVQKEADHAAEIQSAYARTPDIIPPLDVQPIDPAATARAQKIALDKFCPALGRALRGKDADFSRAMILRAADNQLGVLHLAEQDAIKNRRVRLGMSSCMAIAAWGRPERVNQSIGSYGVHEQWVYPANYLYFENNVMTSLQAEN